MKKNIKGFTLIELLIVITILGILSVLGARQFGNATARANAQADVTNAATLAHAFEQWMIENNIEYPEEPIIFKINSSSDITKLENDGEETQSIVTTLDLSKYINGIPQLKATPGGNWIVWIQQSMIAIEIEDDENSTEVYPVLDPLLESGPYAVLN